MDDSQEPDSVIEAGLPDITGKFNFDGRVTAGATINTGLIWYGGGAFTTGTTRDATRALFASAKAGASTDTMDFSAAKSSSVYGKSSTVQPPAYLVNIWKRVE